MNIQELILKKEELSDEQTKFLEVHSKIITSGSMICNNLIELAENLKLMKDEKLYKEAGFLTFEEYSENACGIKKSQAYKYIKILETFGGEIFHTSGKIGVSKLALLSNLSNEEREVIEAEVNISDVSVRELQNEIDKLKSEKDEVSKMLNETKSENLKSQDKISKLKQEITDLKNKPKEKEIVSDPEQQKKIESLETIIKMKEYALNIKNKQLDDLQGQQVIASSAELTEFKILFDEVQLKISRLKKLSDLVPEEKRTGCKEALKKVGEMLC